MNENMKRHVILLEREKKAIIFNWDVFRMHPLLQHTPPPPPPPHQPLSPQINNMTLKRDKFKLTENSQNYYRS